MAYVRRQGRPAVLIDLDDATVAATMRILKAADKGLYDKVRKTMRSEATNIKARQAATVRGLSTSGSRGRSGSTRRAAYGFLRATSGRGGASRANERTLARAIKGSGLRESAARALKIEYRERATARRPFLGVRIRMSAGAMPPDQRRLPKHMNYGRWRHPVFGNRDNWTTQTIAPDGWFDGTFAAMKSGAAAAIDRAMKAAYREAGLLK